MNSSHMVNATISPSCNELAESDSNYVLSGIYSLFVSIGLLGNAIVIAMLLRVISDKGLATNVHIYIVCLSLVDFAYLSTGPFLIYYMISGTWIFGEAACRVVYICEGLNKTMSIYFLVILSGDRYLAACRPTTSARYRSVKAAVIALSVVTVSVFITNVPIYMYTEVKSTPGTPECYQCGIWFPVIDNSLKPPSNLIINDSEEVHLLASLAQGDSSRKLKTDLINGTRTDSELPIPWGHLGSYYALCLIVLYYLLPACFILTFYILIVKRLHRQYRLVQTAATKRNKVTKSVLAVISFYFACWTPYWLLQSVITFWPQLQYNPKFSNVFLYLAQGIYTLPYVNSCIDPILYAFLNKHLRTAYSAASVRRRMKRTRKKSSITDPKLLKTNL